MANSSLLYEAKIPKYKVYHISKLICYSLRPKMLNSVKKLQIFYAKSPEISLATSPAEQAVHGVLFCFVFFVFFCYNPLLIPPHMKWEDLFQDGLWSN